MPVPYDRETTYLLTGGEFLVRNQVQDSHGSCAEYWNHIVDGRSKRFISGRDIRGQGKEYLAELRSREVTFKPEVFGRGYEAVLPDGRPIRKDMVAFPLDHQSLVKYDGYKIVVFKSKEAAVALLMNDPVVRDYVPPAPEQNAGADVQAERKSAAPGPRM